MLECPPPYLQSLTRKNKEKARLRHIFSMAAKAVQLSKEAVPLHQVLRKCYLAILLPFKDSVLATLWPINITLSIMEATRATTTF